MSDKTRRDFLRLSAGGLLLAGAGPWLARLARAGELGPDALPAGTLAESRLEALPGKLPLIKKTYRPPNYETPIEYFREAFTPNEAFFVRYHLSDIPEIDPAAWRLEVGGEAATGKLSLSLADLKRDFELVELAAVCMCAGNRRGLFDPHVPGVQWGHGAMGNARWRGVRLRDVLARAGIARDALEIVFDGADRGPLPKTPDFLKSLPAWKAMDPDTLIAFEMNGAPLPRWNGAPARLVVPGWAATYWIKHLTRIEPVAKAYDGFWMKGAYRIPRRFPTVDRFLSQDTEANTPITDMVVNSLITSVEPGQAVAAGQPLPIAGMAWDGGGGVNRVDVSVDGGRSWQAAELGPDHGRYAFRPFSYMYTPQAKGGLVVLSRAANRIGQAQVFEAIPNPPGYHHNVVSRVELTVV